MFIYACICLAEMKPFSSCFLGKYSQGFWGFSSGDLHVVTLKEVLNRLLVVDTPLILCLDSFFYLIREALAKRVVGIGEGSLNMSHCFLFDAALAGREACLPSSRAFPMIIKSLERFTVAGGNLLRCGCHPINYVQW